MRFGIYVPTFGEYEVPALAALAADAEGAGWDGCFVWDHVAWTPEGAARELADTTVALTAIALATERIRFGALVTPPARRRPWKLAKETATLDRLSGGRLVFGAGLGAAADLEPFGEGREPRELAGVLDEGLEVLARLWTGEPVDHTGPAFRLRGAALRPPPLQRPRIPVWVAGFWPNRPPFRRAARWDGVLPLARGHLLKELTPGELGECVAYVRAHRTHDGPFDVIAFAVEQPRTPDAVAAYAQAGATWWIDAVHPRRETQAAFRDRVRAGPPRHS